MDVNHIVVLVTAKDEEEAATISRKLLEDKLAACVNIVKQVRSLFRWEGKVDDVGEALMVIKTQEVCFERLVKAVRSVHSYTVPEIIALPIIHGYEPYLKWVSENAH